MMHIESRTVLLAGLVSIFLTTAPVMEMVSPAHATISKEKNDRQNGEQKNGGGGEGKSELEIQKELAKDLHNMRLPQRLRTNIISSTGLVVGGAVGEAATTFFTCILKCIPGVRVDYQPGDFWRQTMKGQREIWGIKEPPRKKGERQAFGPPKPAAQPANREDGFIGHKYGFEYRPSRFGGIRVRNANGQSFHVKYGGKIQVGDKVLIASINPTGRSYFFEE